MNLVNELDTVEGGKWFFIDKANNFNNEDRYVGQISNTTGKVKIWDLKNGKLMDVCYTDNIDPLDLNPSIGGVTYNIPAYDEAYTCEGEEGEDPSEDYFTLNDPEVDDLQVLTINDYTFVTNRKVPVKMSKNDEEKKPPQATVELRSIAGLTEYDLDIITFTVDDPVTTASKISVAGTGFDTDSDGGCSSNTTQQISDITGQNTGSEGKNLDIELKTTSIVVPDSEGVRKCVYTTTVTIKKGGEGWKVGDTFERVYDGVTYKFTIEEVLETNEVENTERVSVTTARENPKADDVLDSFVTQIEALGLQCERIGNSLYIKHDEAFTVTTPNSILLRVLSSTNIGTEDEPNYVVQANDIDQVPLQTKHNLVFQIRNSFSDADDYYVQFKGDNDSDGTGTYVEVAKPGIDNLFMPDSMPHGILRLSETYNDADGDLIRTFLVASFKWAPREAGDDNTVPRPSFAPEEGASFGRPINQLAFFRNRFVMLTDENVVCSTAGDFFNFWAKTATTVSPSDPIDLQVSNNYPAVLYGAQPTTAGLLLFSENAQFMLSTENDVLEPRTARTTLLSTYNYNRNSNTVSLGTTVGFVSGIGRYTRFYEMANISRDQEPEVVEQTKVIERLIPGGYNYIGISKDNQLVAFGKTDTDEVWIFRYFNTGERRAQSAWVRWILPGNLVSHALINDSYFSVLRKGNKTWLCRGDVRALQSTIMLDDEDGEDYRTFLDYAVAVNEYTEGPRNSIVIDGQAVGFPVFHGMEDKIVSVVWDPTEEQGYIVPVKVRQDGMLSIRSDIPDQKIFIGYPFEFRIDLPKFYVKKEGEGAVQSWDTANVLIQRVKLNFGRIGYYETTLKRLGRDDYTQIYEAKPMDKYDANELGYVADYEQTTPVYQRNTGFTMSISSEHPSPAVLYSATWEGQYQENYVKRL